MPSPPPPTTLQPGDPVWWRSVGGEILTGHVVEIHPDRRRLRARRSDGGGIIGGGAQHFNLRQTYIPDVVGPGEARTLMDGISRQRLAELRAQPHFPPARELAQGPVWSRPELLAWHRDRTDKRSTPRARFLMSYRKHGSVYAAAKSLDIPSSTAYRWAHELQLLDPAGQKDPSA